MYSLRRRLALGLIALASRVADWIDPPGSGGPGDVPVAPPTVQCPRCGAAGRAWDWLVRTDPTGWRAD